MISKNRKDKNRRDIINSETTDMAFARFSDKQFKSRLKDIDSVKENILVSSKIKRFKQVDDTSLISFECPSCNKTFGLKEMNIGCQESNIHYFCPYCGEDRGLED